MQRGCSITPVRLGGPALEAFTSYCLSGHTVDVIAAALLHSQVMAMCATLAHQFRATGSGQEGQAAGATPSPRAWRRRRGTGARATQASGRAPPACSFTLEEDAPPG